MITATVHITNNFPGSAVPDNEVSGQFIFVNSPAGIGMIPILVSPEDALKTVQQPVRGFVRVTDLITGNEHKIARAACGLGCFCGAKIV